MTRRVLASPLGPLSLTVSSGAIVRLVFGPSCEEGETDPLVASAAAWLVRYFDGDSGQCDLPLEPAGTAFQRRVWQALSTIPYGATISYGELARRVGDPGAVRAVGRANGANPISLLIPCHRVIGASGKLVGFGGGLERKAALLDHERGFARLSEVSRQVETFSGVE